MKKLLLTAAVALVGLASAASAQSVLERVLDSISATNMLPVTGTFANIAENVAVLHTTPGSDAGWTDAGNAAVTEADLLLAYSQALSIAQTNYISTNWTLYDPDQPLPWFYDGVWYLTQAEAEQARTDAFYATVWTYTDYTDWAPLNGYTYNEAVAPTASLLNSIDGSISNTMTGIAQATAQVGTDVLAFSEVQVDIGDLSTTVLGAVNTGDITLGVNQDVSEAISGTSSAVSSSIGQLGGVIDQTALVLNVASNATSVVGSVTNSFTSLNGSIGNVATTVLGAVNTGTITSGINAAVSGVQAGIIGN